VLVGGPLTFSNPLPAAPFADAMILGEADDVVVRAVRGSGRATARCVARRGRGAARRIRARTTRDGLAGHRESVGRNPSGALPDPHPGAELSDMFLVEGERGCHRQCTFCVMRRSTNGGMRLATTDRIFDTIPDEARRVGLVGAAISDHPDLVGLLQRIVDSGREVGVSSLRADRVALKPDIPRLLRKAGYQTLTVASDAASQRLRREIVKGTTEKHLVACAEAAREHEFRLLKVYMMVGLPGETDDDVEELVRFTNELARIHPTVLGVAPFVPKKNTPLDTASFAGIKVVEDRLRRITRGLRSPAEMRPTSARWAWAEYRLAQGGPRPERPSCARSTTAVPSPRGAARSTVFPVERTRRGAPWRDYFPPPPLGMQSTWNDPETSAECVPSSPAIAKVPPHVVLFAEAANSVVFRSYDVTPPRMQL
jgi:radical SAM superfamily enzyme YgiQ (UPF0313 family)